MSPRAKAALVLSAILCFAAPGAAMAAAAPLRIVSVDVEGGAATLFVTPEGRSLLIDTGWPDGMPTRTDPAAPAWSSADRIVAAAASLGVHRIDYLLITHYHVDHLGGLSSLMAKMPVGVLIDHGPNREIPPPDASPRALAHAPQTTYPLYLALIAGHRRIQARPGQTLRIGSMTLNVVASDGDTIRRPLAGAGRTNPACAGVPDMDALGGEENVRSVATVITFGRTRIAALGDLSWNREKQLACPADLVGPVDVLFVTQHGSDLSSNPALVGALAPSVAIMANGAVKGGDVNAITTVSQAPGLQGFWRLHSSVRHPQTDGPPDYIANLATDPDAGWPIRLAISSSGEIEVTNPRNGVSHVYRSRDAAPGG
jgi:beta-lactamase superfamily II metal-dependent hydrolase